MELLLRYDQLSHTNNVDILGIDLSNYPEKSWRFLSQETSIKETTRLMGWVTNDLWMPIADYGTLFLGVINYPAIREVIFRFHGDRTKEYKGILTWGYWRLTELPFPLECTSDILEIKVVGRASKIELAWLVVPLVTDRRILAEINPDDFKKLDVN